MENILITEQELEYRSNIPCMICEKVIPLKPQKNLDETSKNAIVLDAFFKKYERSYK